MFKQSWSGDTTVTLTAGEALFVWACLANVSDDEFGSKVCLKLYDEFNMKHLDTLIGDTNGDMSVNALYEKVAKAL